MSLLRVLGVGLDWFPEHGGGLDRYFYDLLRHAHEADIELRGLVAGRATVADETNGQVAAFARREQSLVSRALAVRRATRNLMQEWRPELVAVHFAAHALPALDLLTQPLVVHFQGPWAMESGIERQSSSATRVKHHVERTVYLRADRCIVLSEAFGTILADRYGVDPARIRVVPGSVDTERFAAGSTSRRDARAALGWPMTRRIVLCVRRLVPRMGLVQLIEAVAQVSRDHPDLLCLIAGKGGEESDLRDLVARTGTAEHIRLLGFVADDDLPAAYRAADLSIVPTQALEGFGLIVAESLAAGTPVLVTPIGGLPETVLALSPDLVLDGADVDDIAAGLRRWISGERPVPDAERCRAYAHEHFGWSTGVRRIRAVYDEAVGSRRA